MNSRGKRNFLRQTSYIEKCKKEDEIRLLRLYLIKKRSTEEIINNIWREPAEHHTQERDVVNLLASSTITEN